jgi:hypothetical protein
MTASLNRFQQLAFPADILAAQQQPSAAGPSMIGPGQAALGAAWTQTAPSSRHRAQPPGSATIPEVAPRHGLPPEPSRTAGASGLYTARTPPSGRAWPSLTPVGPLPPPSSARAQMQRAPLPPLSGPGAGMNLEDSPSGMSKTRDMSIANLVNAPPVGMRSHSLGGPSPYSVDPASSRLPPITSPRALPYPLTASSSAGASSVQRQSSEAYNDALSGSDSGGESAESDEGSLEMDEVDQTEEDESPGHRAARQGSLAPSASKSPSRGEQST